ncbi:MAG: hypothetical protein RLZZ117_1250 [Cyanobacteriota bacterium]|jgi:hypothetical protein
MQKFWMRLVAGQRQGDDSDRMLQGGIEVITPSLIAGWAHHPEHTLCDVRLLAGPHLLAQARIDHLRPDVETHLQRTGVFGFQLEIPADLPLLRIEAPPQVLALTADGSHRFLLTYIGSRPSTEQRLRAALEPERRGLRGHFDGLTPDGTKIHGWCYQAGERSPARVWFHGKDLATKVVTCQEQRPGMALQGHSETCGFHLAVADWPEAAGATIWASFDSEGLLRLPQSSPVQLPPREPQPTSLQVWQPEPEASPPDASSSLLTEPFTGLEEEPTAQPVENSEHWQALDGFRRYLDSLERELDRQDQLRFRPPRPSSLWARLLGSRR